MHFRSGSGLLGYPKHMVTTECEREKEGWGEGGDNVFGEHLGNFWVSFLRSPGQITWILRPSMDTQIQLLSLDWRKMTDAPPREGKKKRPFVGKLYPPGLSLSQAAYSLLLLTIRVHSTMQKGDPSRRNSEVSFTVSMRVYVQQAATGSHSPASEVSMASLQQPVSF